jgi:DNA replication and repair protein RecF
MRIAAIGLQNFRNVAAARLEFSGRLQFLVGANGQGKTNLLEAAGFITALRSFRSTDQSSLVQQGHREAAILADLDHDRDGNFQLKVGFKSGAKEAWLDGQRIQRLGDVIGKFPTVAFSSQDQQLVRGSPAGRRRWLDLTLSATDATYLTSLQAYHRALAGRNALLKRRASEAEFAAFETVLADHGAELVKRRRAAFDQLAGVLTERYAHIADRAEPTGFAYMPQVDLETAAPLQAKLAANRARDQMLKSTGNGPHRDDFAFTVSGRSAKDFASEGQQRALVLSLRLAQAAWFRERTRVEPVLLADDVLGELDPTRRERFWSAVPAQSQVIATGTELPDGAPEDWQVFTVRDGSFTPVSR